ncbi:MAG: hypothetical protein U1E62_16725 [Alsobacter sp.]
MTIGQTTARDPLAGTGVQQGAGVAPPAPAAASAPQPQAGTDRFGPATKVEIGADGPRSVPGQSRFENVISIDDTTRSVVFKSLNMAGDVVFQIPDESKLRLRAYLDEVAQHQAASTTAGTHPNPSAIDSIRV